ncbi:MAG: ECF transporter S component [Oscillospiraceae bacterium]|jgi:uncharacterized membrane protein|nr:ECF transporter S component [Oscillospiraceae bacterium]
MKKANGTRKLVLLAMLTAIVVVLQFLGAFIRFGPFSISLVLLPIVVGAALTDPLSGGWLGLVFGAVVLLSGDAAAFLAISPLATVIIVIAKGALAGLAAGFVYKLLEKKNKLVAVVSAAVVAPVVNTGIFLLGCSTAFLPTIKDWAAHAGYESVGTFMFLGLVGGNFIFEFLVNVVLSPAIVRLIQYGQKQKA